jgi:hypothetical protein
MKANPNLIGYNQADVESLLNTGYIVPNIDEYSNLIIQNVTGQLYSSSISIELKNVIYEPVKVETRIETQFTEL